MASLSVAGELAAPAVRYLYTGADQAVIEKSPFFGFQSPEEVSDVQVQELKLASLFIPKNSTIVITQTFLHESRATRASLSRVASLIDNGLIRIFSPTLSSFDFVEHKREAYANVRHIRKYREAYFSRNSTGIELPFQFEAKNFSTGNLAHSLWTQEAAILGKQHRIEARLSDALKRIADADTGNSTWESTHRELQPVAMSKLLHAKLHALSFTTYIDAHRLHGVGAIVGSRIATYLFTGHFPLFDFDIEVHRRGLLDAQALADLDAATDVVIVRARRHLQERSEEGPRFSSTSTHSFYTEVGRILRLSSRVTPVMSHVSSPNKSIKLSEISFDIALSFPGSHRSFVEQVYGELRTLDPTLAIFYDFHFQAELARPDLDITIQRVYERQSRLVVVFFGQSYAESEWCGLEWRVVRDLIKKKKSEQIMLVKLNDVDLGGLFSIDGYVDAQKHSSDQIANAIQTRLLTLPAVDA